MAVFKLKRHKMVIEVKELLFGQQKRQRPAKQASGLEEQVLNSPEVQEAINRIAEGSLGKNPVLGYVREQFRHAAFHFEDWLWFRYDRHPALSYCTPKQAIKKSADYFEKFGVHIPYLFRSFFRLEKDIEPDRNLNRYFFNVGRKINFDAKKMRLENKARKYYRGMAAAIDPEMLEESRRIAKEFVEGSFSGVSVKGLEEKIHGGKSVSDILHEGGALVFQNHPSYTGLAINKHLYSMSGLDGNMYTIAGNNILNIKDKENIGWLNAVVRGSGAILVERNMPQGRDALLYYEILKEYIASLLSQGANITLYIGNGRDKGDREAALKTVVAEVIWKARHVVTVAESHDVVPDDHELAFGGSSKQGASIEDMFALKRDDKGKTYGGVYLVFGTPVNPAGYAGLSKKDCQDDITNRIRGLVTLTPTYVLAAAVKGTKAQRFTIEQISRPVQGILNYAEWNGLYVSEELAGMHLPLVMQNAAETLVKRGALSIQDTGEYGISGRHEETMLAFYAAKIEGTLNGGMPKPIKRSSSYRR